VELFLILVATFAAAFFAVYGFLTLWGRRERIRARFEWAAATEGGSTLLKSPAAASPMQQKVMDWLAYSGGWALKDPERLSQVRIQLIQAGYRHPQALAVFYGIKAVFALLLPLPFLTLYVIQGKLNPGTLALSFALAGMGFLLPNYLLAVRVRTRQNALDRALPDVLDLFVICMEAGLALNAALNKVAEEIRAVYPEFWQELQITAAELRAGIPWDEAFEHLGQRTGVQSIRSMVGLMIQSEKLGASIAQALRNHGDFTRAQRMLRAEEKAAKLPLKMVFPLILCMLPVMLIVTVGPGVLHIIKIFLPLARRSATGM